MRRLYFTADVDRDVNVQVLGRTAAGSLDRGSGDSPRFSSSERGLGLLLDVLDRAGIRGTLFFEGRTSETADCARAAGHCIGMHGYDHEDLTSLPDDELAHTILRTYDVVSDNVGRPTCSRAPYMSADSRVLRETASRTGIRRDSSFYTAVGSPCAPYAEGTVLEFPVPKARDPDGKIIAAYLWPMHEGKRRPDDYIGMATRIEGDIVIADHSWHMCETRAGGVMDREAERACSDDVLRVIEGILDLGFRPGVIG